jgi:NAD(P)H-flavin reductase
MKQVTGSGWLVMLQIGSAVIVIIGGCGLAGLLSMVVDWIVE